MLFFTSGLWLDDEKMAVKRKFVNANDMNRCIIQRWNKVVTEEDTVYILGDVGEFGYLKELHGDKIILMANSDMKLYHTYIESISDSRDESYDKEMFDVYVSNEYKVNHIQYHKRCMKRIYSGRILMLTTDYTNYKSPEMFNLANLGEYLKAGKHYLNVTTSMNYMTPVSEVEVEGIIKKAGNL